MILKVTKRKANGIVQTIGETESTESMSLAEELEQQQPQPSTSSGIRQQNEVVSKDDDQVVTIGKLREFFEMTGLLKQSCKNDFRDTETDKEPAQEEEDYRRRSRGMDKNNNNIANCSSETTVYRQAIRPESFRNYSNEQGTQRLSSSSDEPDNLVESSDECDGFVSPLQQLKQIETCENNLITGNKDRRKRPSDDSHGRQYREPKRKEGWATHDNRK